MKPKKPKIDELIARSSLGAAMRDIEERGIDAHADDLAREMRPRRAVMHRVRLECNWLTKIENLAPGDACEFRDPTERRKWLSGTIVDNNRAGSWCVRDADGAIHGLYIESIRLPGQEEAWSGVSAQKRESLMIVVPIGAASHVRHFTLDLFPITIRIRSGKTGELLWSRTITRDEARQLASLEVPSYYGTEHYPAPTEVTYEVFP
jgi:hypothetical protein